MTSRATRFFGAALVGLALWVATSQAHATTMPERTPAEVAAESELVVEGRVLDARVERVRGRLVTLRTLQVERVLRSPRSWEGASPTRAGDTLTVVLPGGELEGVGQRVAGTPALQVGARYLLCLSAPLLHGARTVVGLWQGAWRVDGQGALIPFTHEGEAAAAASRPELERALAGSP